MRNNGTVNFLVQGHNDERKLLCYDCLKDFAEIVQETSEYVNSNDAENSFEPTINEDKVAGQNQKATPSKLKRCLDKFIIGQEKAKRALTTLIYNHIMMIKAKENGEDIRTGQADTHNQPRNRRETKQDGKQYRSCCLTLHSHPWVPFLTPIPNVHRSRSS